MDQNSTGGSDKRNWRERLGIGTKDGAVIAKDMPKVSDEFKPTPAPMPVQPRVAPATARPAPMAPRPAAARPAAAPGTARPAAQPAPRAPAVAPDVLANKLKAQRDAAERLADQRVAAAKQRAESSIPPATNGNAPKPKFTFADEEAKASAPRPAAMPSRAPPQVQRPVPSPEPQQGYANQIAPPRPPLGGGQAMPPRAVPPQQQPYVPQAYPQGQPYYPQQQPQYPQGYAPQQPQGYAPVPPPGYRPIDPATGYTPPPPYNPQPRPQFTPTGAGAGPRLQVPQRQPATGFNTPQSGFGANPRLTNPQAMRQAPTANYADGEEDDIFEQPAPRAQRRATAEDYSQAYREVETGLDEDPQRSGRPLMLLALLGLLVASALLAVWGYTNYVKNGGSLTAAGNNVPVVAAPEKPAKATPDAAATDNAAAGKAVNSSKKLIYDRIVGDQEVPTGKLVPSEEQPVQPSNNSAPINSSGDSVAPAAPAAGTGDDGTPLPLPPPPGGTQGSLEPSGKTDAAKTDQAMINPAASESLAAVPIPAGNQNSAAAVVAAGSDAIAQTAEASKPAAPAAEAIADNMIPNEPVIKEKKSAAKTVEAKKKTATDANSKSLGAKPVVLVAPSKLALQNKNPPAKIKSTNNQTTNDGGGLYGDTAVDSGNVTAGAVEALPVEQPKKRKTLLDLFRTDSQTAEPEVVVASVPKTLPTQQVAAASPRVVAPVPTAGTGAYVAQLASFKSKAEANAEYSRLVIKHGPIIKRYAPIIEQASVAGSTRYRLNIGPMASTDVASSFCSSLFAAGERDCLVHRQ